jgi:hypothetical protein
MMRAMAVFLTNGRFFYLAHAALDPPTNLCKKVFPLIDDWHDRPAVKELSPDNNNPIQPTAAQEDFYTTCHLIW